MDFTVAILLGTYIVSIIALFLFVYSMSKGMFGDGSSAAQMIFDKDEIGHTEDPAATNKQKTQLQLDVGDKDSFHHDLDSAELKARVEADQSTSLVVGICFTLAVIWLVIASVAGLISSIKLHSPDWLVGYDWITFGRIRPIHVNIVAYGWCALSGIGVSIWLLPRLLKTKLVGARWAIAGGGLWTIGVFLGVVAIALGKSDGMEFLEFPWKIDILLIVGGALVGVPLWLTLLNRQVDHLYVSIWYIAAALLWFPTLFFIANLPNFHIGVEQATVNWWFGHNVLGLFFSPIGLATIYYFVPKVLGKPIHNYNISLLGFWALAFFYSQVGGHHLIGGPVPSWFITLSVTQSVMMVIPVVALFINQYYTLKGNWRALVHSPTLRFIVFGLIMYILSSIQGSMEALRSVNTITHFTHFTVAHAHLGLYGFFTMVMFGAMYYIMPRIMHWEWPYPSLIALHFWLVFIGFAIYIIWLSIGGWLQGLAMLDVARPFMDSVTLTIPYLQARSLGGGLMTLGHFVFALHFFVMAWKFGPRRLGAAVLGPEMILKYFKKGAAS
jgi:cytochrome c oxidase cbb3-type subunit 1